MSPLSKALRASASGLAAERFRMDVISVNIANANSMKVGGKDPYRRREVVLTPTADGVRIGRMVEDTKPFRVEHDPGNPNADKDGNVTYSNVGEAGPWNYTPVPDVNGFDAAVRAIRVAPAGPMSAAGAGNPSFTLQFQVRIR